MITLEEFKNKNLCICYRDNLIDYDSLEVFYDLLYQPITNNCDPVEFDNDVQRILDQAKRVEVYAKRYMKVTVSDIKDYIHNCYEEFYTDYNKVYYSDEAESFLENFLDELSKYNEMWDVGKFVGYIDLSKEVGKFIKEDYGDNE